MSLSGVHCEQWRLEDLLTVVLRVEVRGSSVVRMWSEGKKVGAERGKMANTYSLDPNPTRSSSSRSSPRADVLTQRVETSTGLPWYHGLDL